MRFITVVPDFDISGIGIELSQQYVRVGFCKSKSEFRRLIEQGGIRVSDRVVKDPLARLAYEDNEWVLVQHEIHHTG